LAESYRARADACRQMAQQASDRFSRDWLDIAGRWIRLAREAEAHVADKSILDALPTTQK
jgi:hypothetical protein